ncbi:MAG: Hsp20/alpha crystallin family protein [Phycisphaerae bacterium]|nr:Hsp20/alpha crystallin family protein [Phycisphaerae bacterium]
MGDTNKAGGRHHHVILRKQAIEKRHHKFVIKPHVRAGEAHPEYHQYCPGEPWEPTVNIFEDNRNYYVTASLAGVESKLIDLDYCDNILTISGYCPTSPPPKVYGTLSVRHMEIDHGRFSRSLVLPEDTIPDEIEAICRTGQLMITIPKKC